MALAMGHVMLREFHLDKPSQYFTDYVRRYTDMPMLVMLESATLPPAVRCAHPTSWIPLVRRIIRMENRRL